MAVPYRLETLLEHTSHTIEEADFDDLVLGGSARIVCDTDVEDDDEGETVGNVRFYVVKLGLAMDQGMNAMEVCDALSQDLCEYAAAVLGDDGQYTEELIDSFDIPGGDLLILHTVTVLPAYRGQDLGLLAAARIVDLFGEGFVICRPQPLQHVHDTDAHRESLDPSIQYELFTKTKAAAKTALQSHWSKLGFERIGRTDFYGLSMAQARPKLRLKVRSATKTDASMKPRPAAKKKPKR